MELMAAQRWQPPLILLFAFLGIGIPFIPRRGAPSPGTPAAQPAPAQPQLGSCEARFLAPLAGFFGSDESNDLKSRWQKLGYSITSMIVTMADPIESDQFQFDRSLDAVRRAAGAAGYLPDRYYLPWPLGRAPEASAKGSGDEGAAGTRATRCQDELPGRLLFRHHREPRLLQVFVVGEVASWGLNQRAFARTLQEASAILPVDSTVRIVGPTFSGTSRSLRDGIKLFRQDHPDLRFQIVTGSATSRDNREVLSDPPASALRPPSPMTISSRGASTACWSSAAC